MAKRKLPAQRAQQKKARVGTRDAEAEHRATAQRRFLAAFADVGTIWHAAEQAGVGRRTHYDWLATDRAYAAEFEEALGRATDALEGEARRRAITGVDEPVFYQGVQCGTVRKHSDTLLIFLLKGRRREVFGDKVEHTGRNGGPIQTLDLTRLTTEELRQARELAAKAQG